ncbi:gliding motility-associated C-terminal domain-containing protein, partial [Jejuia spongiicola]
VTTTEFETEVSVSCGDIPDAPELEFEDACSSEITVEFEETSSNNGTTNDYEIIRTWTVIDECGNPEMYTQTVFVAVNGATGGTADLCIDEDLDFDLFSLLNDDFDFDGTWSVISNNATINGSLFNPTSLLDFDGNYTFEQLQDTYTFMYTSNTGDCPTETEVTVTLNDSCRTLPCDDRDGVIISKAVTANGDQWNEYFSVTGIEGCGFTVQVQIFNRWGALIYENNDYENNWNGFAHSRSAGSSGKVPTGTYFYILNLIDSGISPFSGSIYVGTK